VSLWKDLRNPDHSIGYKKASLKITLKVLEQVIFNKSENSKPPFLKGVIK